MPNIIPISAPSGLKEIQMCSRNGFSSSLLFKFQTEFEKQAIEAYYDEDNDDVWKAVQGKINAKRKLWFEKTTIQLWAFRNSQQEVNSSVAT